MGDPIINTQVDAINTTLGTIKTDLTALRPSIQRIRDAVAETYLTETIQNQAIASFSDGADDIPVRELECAITPVQSLNGQTSPYPAGGGKNLLDPKVHSGMTYNPTIGSTVTLTDAPTQLTEANGVFTTTLNQWAGRVMLAPITASTAYWIKVTITGDDVAVTTGLLSSSYEVLNTTNRTGASVAIDGAFTPSQNGYYFVFFTNRASGSKTVTLSYPQIEAGSTATAWTPYSNICPITGWSAANVTRTGKNICPISGGVNNVVLCAVKSGQTYTFSLTTSNKCGFNLKKNDNSGASVAAYIDAQGRVSVTFTADEDFDLFLNGYSQTTGVTFANSVTDFQLEFGNTATAYEPYLGTTHAIDWGINQWDEEWEVVSSNIWSKNFISVQPSTDYYISTAGYNIQVIWYDSTQTSISNVTKKDTVITSPSNARYMKFFVASGYGTTYNNDISINYPSTYTTYHPYADPFIGTVYGGTLNVTTGVLRVTKYTDTIPNDGNWTIATTGVRRQFQREGALTYNHPIIANQNIISNWAVASTTTNDSALDLDYWTARGGNYSSKNIFVTTPKSLVGMTVDEFKAFLVANPLQICYTLATPTTVQLTAEEVTTLFGQNNVWADTGNVVKLTYRKAWEIALAEGE